MSPTLCVFSLLPAIVEELKKRGREDILVCIGGLGYGYVIGELYSLKERSYPALLPGNSRILGEIYEVDEAAARAVDALEEYVPGSSENEYEKINTQILDEQGRQLDILPVYWYHVEKPGNRELLDEIIQEHDFTAYCKAKAS